MNNKSGGKQKIGITMVILVLLILTTTSISIVADKEYKTQDFPIEEYTKQADNVTITLVSADNINVTSDGFITYVFNITTESTAINNDSVLVAYGVSSDGSLVSHNWSFRIPASPIQPNEVRAHNRNMNEWFEKFNDSGTGEIGSIGEWQVLTLQNSTGVTVLEWGTNYTKIQFRPVATNLFPQTWYVDRTFMIHENKTGQYSPIYQNNMLKTRYNTNNIPVYYTHLTLPTN